MVNSELQIRDVREKAGITQEELAEQMEVSRQTISRWETGATRPSADKLARLSQVLGVSADALLGVESVPTAETPVEAPAETPAPVSRRNRGFLVLLAALILAAGILLGALLFGRWGPDAVPTSNTGSEVVASSGEQPEDIIPESELDVWEVDPSMPVMWGKLLPLLPEEELDREKIDPAELAPPVTLIPPW